MQQRNQSVLVWIIFINIIIIIINNQPTDKVQRPVGWNTMKTGLSSTNCPGLYGI